MKFCGARIAFSNFQRQSGAMYRSRMDSNFAAPANDRVPLGLRELQQILIERGALVRDGRSERVCGVRMSTPHSTAYAAHSLAISPPDNPRLDIF